MADENATKMTESALKETLCAQQQLLQKLYNELDAEREASATAASEALSVILRLQGEKAAIKMESEQYKRLSEEKMCHAEESLAIIEDIIYQKEMEVAAMDHQVQAYRCKLLSMGCMDVGIGDIKFSENFLQRSTSLGEQTSFRRLSCERGSSVGADEQQPMDQDVSDCVPRLDKKISSNLSSADIDSYWEQIRRLGIQVKEIAGGNYMNSWNETRSVSSVSSQLSVGNAGNRTRSPSPQISFCSPCDATTLATVNETEETSCSTSYAKNVVAGDYPSSPSIIHDVFEVPRADQSFRFSESVVKGESKREVVHPEAVKVHFPKEKADGMKKKVWKPTQRKKRILRQNADHLRATVTEVNRLRRTSEIVEVETAAKCNNSRYEEMKLLKEMKEEISCLRQEVKNLTVKESSLVSIIEEPLASLNSLQEAMLYFWA